MSTNDDELWLAMAESGAALATEKDYAHGYVREVRTDLEQYVVFRVGPEWHGLPIACIREISKLFETTPVPHTAPFVVGIGNVRGRVMPVLDLATRLELPSRVRGSESRMLIVEHRGELYALVVDEVDQVVALPPEHLERAPGTIRGARGEFIHALARHGGRLIVVLSLDGLLDPESFVDVGGLP